MSREKQPDYTGCKQQNCDEPRAGANANRGQRLVTPPGFMFIKLSRKLTNVFTLPDYLNECVSNLHPRTNSPPKIGNSSTADAS